MRASARLAALILALGLGSASCAATNAAPAKDFQAWLEDLREEARGRGISEPTLDATLAGLAPIPGVIERDRRQAEFTLTFARYLEITMPAQRVERGRQLLAENRELLRGLEERYGVPGEYLVALWGIESSFGQTMGTYPVIAALATLAHDGRRSAFFRKELLAALQIVDEGHITPARMLGSWAGAMGQNQFMPSSFVNNAVDHDGDGRRDIWGTPADVLASAANYLARSGWKRGEPWGLRVIVPPGVAASSSLVQLDAPKPVTAWREAGVKGADGRELPDRPAEGSLVQPGGTGGPSFLVFDNFRAILRWNRAIYFATSAGLLADRIAGR